MLLYNHRRATTIINKQKAQKVLQEISPELLLPLLLLLCLDYFSQRVVAETSRVCFCCVVLFSLFFL